MVAIDPKTKRLIEGNPLAFATVDKKGHPNVIGVACVKVVASDQILITDNYMRQTLENLNVHPDICLAVWDKGCNGVKIVGTAQYFINGKWKTIVEGMPDNKGLPAKGAILVTVTGLIGLK